MAYNILIVDDSLPMRAVIKKVIKASGFDVGEFYEAENGKNALNVLNDEWVDLIISDYNMPVMNGLEMLESIKKNDMFSSIPVIMVTTEGSQQRVEEFFKSGAADYIKKPFTPEQIKSKLVMIMGETENESEEAGIDNSDDGFDF